MAENVTATAYLVVEGERYRYGAVDPETGLKKLTSAKVVGLRQSRPRTLGLDQVVVKVSIQLPMTVFDPIAPAALIVVPEDLVIREIVAEAVAEEA